VGEGASLMIPQTDNGDAMTDAIMTRLSLACLPEQTVGQLLDVSFVLGGGY